MTKITHKEVDASVESTLRVFDRLTPLSVTKLTLHELHFLDQTLSREMQGRLAHVIDNASDRSELVDDVAKNSRYAGAVGEFVKHYTAHGTMPKKSRLHLVSQKKMSGEYRVLTPYLLTSMKSDSYLIAFENASLGGDGGKAMWFTALDETQHGFTCLGYHGEKKNIAFTVIEEMGYSRIDEGQAELKSRCKSALKGHFGADSVKEVGFFLSKKTIPSAERRDAVDRLSRFLDGLDHAPVLAPQTNSKPLTI